ncbi:MAG: ArsI/CadI family heavy metal resistance metalloenzyme [Acidimicrobiia bacterium]|jgi:catechol 2,3-dioxygenase-like lactoylglutathione lyase family enzyme
MIDVPETGRVQLALNVTDLDRAVEFYTKVFGIGPAKRRPGYANFAVAEPPLKLVLIESAEGGTLNHLGVEVRDTRIVNEATKGFVDAGITTFEEQGVECCYAKQDKVFVTDPDGAEWEWYTVLDDADTMTKSSCC